MRLATLRQFLSTHFDKNVHACGYKKELRSAHLKLVLRLKQEIYSLRKSFVMTRLSRSKSSDPFGHGCLTTVSGGILHEALKYNKLPQDFFALVVAHALGKIEGISVRPKHHFSK